MRLTDLLLEYNRELTAQTYKSKLIQAAKKDPSLDLTDDTSDQEIIDFIMGELEQGDPTRNKQYTQWLVKCYVNEKVRLEDIVSKGADWLETYDEMKRKNVLPLELRNINRLTFQELYNIVVDAELGGALEAERLKALPKGQSKEWLNNNHVRIIQPLDEDAAKYSGNGTQWCTAARNNNMFRHYASQGPMFILLPKHAEYEGEKYQVHAESGQFMNEQDEPVSPIKLAKVRFGDILPVLKQADPVMSQMIIFADDAVLNNLMEQVKDMSADFISDKLTDWESQDEYFYPWLKDQGYIDDNGDIDYEKAPTYFDYNPDAEEYYDRLVNAVSLSPNELRDAADEYANDNGVSPLIDKFDELVIYAMVGPQSSRSDREALDGLADWIRTNLYTEKGIVKKINKHKTTAKKLQGAGL